MGPERRLHPASFLFAMGRHLKALVVPIAAIVFTAGSRGRDWDTWLFVLLVPYAIAALARSLSFRYRFDAVEMVVRKGWIFRSERHIPYARIQNIDVVQNPFHRALGVAEVRVETAAGGEPEAVMTVLPADAVGEMRRFVFAGRSEAAPETAAAEPADADAPVLLGLGPGELLLYGAIESRGAVVIAGAAGLAWEFGLFDRYFEAGVLRRILRSAVGQGGTSIALVGQAAAALAALILLMRALSMIWAFVRLYGFAVRRAGEDLRVEYGLFTRISGTIPLQRIQTLTIADGPLHRLFDRLSVHVDTAGGHGAEAQRAPREPIAPLIRRADLETLLTALLPGVPLAAAVWQPPHPRAARRAFIRGCIVTAILSGLLAFVLRWWALGAAAALCAWSWFYARRYVEGLGWALVADAVAFRTGWLWRRRTVARFAKVQVVTRQETPFDRRTGMATVRVDTAGSGSPSQAVEIPFVPAAVADTLTATLYARAAETAFRW